MKELKEKVSITLDSNVISTIKSLADDDSRNFSQYINMVLKNHIIEKEHSYIYQNEPSVFSDKVADPERKK